MPSISAAAQKGHSLALIRPKNARFTYRRKSSRKIEMERAAYADAAKQTEMFDEELAALNPSPFEFRFKFEDDSTHDFQNGDWEAHAMFYRELKRTGRESEVLDWMDNTFNVEYPKNGCSSPSAIWPSVPKLGSCSAFFASTSSTRVPQTLSARAFRPTDSRKVSYVGLGLPQMLNL